MSPVTALVPGAFVVIWATGFITARFIVPYAAPAPFIALRVLAVLAVLGVMASLTRARFPGTLAGWRDPMIAGFLMHGVYIGCTFWAVSRGMPAGVAALVGSLQPLLTAALSGPLLAERVSPRRWAGIGLGFLGAGLVLAPKLGFAQGIGAASGAIPLTPLAACLCGMIARTLGTLWQKRTGGQADLIAGATVQFLGAGVFAVPLALATGGLAVEPSLPLVFAMGWAVLVNSVGGILLLLVLIRRGAVAGVAALLFAVPPVAAVIAYLLFGETLGPVQLVGMAVAAAGVALASRG